MRVTVPEGWHPLLYIQTEIGSKDLRDTLREISHVLFYNGSTTVTPQEREAVRYYASWMMGCNSCSQFRAPRDLPDYPGDPISDEWYDRIPEYRTWDGFTERERLAIDFTQRFLTDHVALAADDDIWDRMHEHFTEVEIQDLSIMSSLMYASNLLRETLVATPGSSCAVPTPS